MVSASDLVDLTSIFEIFDDRQKSTSSAIFRKFLQLIFEQNEVLELRLYRKLRLYPKLWRKNPNSENELSSFENFRLGCEKFC